MADTKEMPHPHGGQRVLSTGQELSKAKAAMILLHGRGDSAEGILQLAQYFPNEDFAYIAPNAATQQWYPNRFIAPLESNEPWLSSALRVVGEVIDHVVEAGIPREKIIVLGFSQGACLTLEYAARNATRYGGVVALSGGLIGPQGTPRNYPGSLDNTPVFLGCSDVDFHIPVEVVKESTVVMGKIGGDVTERIYPGMGHTINDDEITYVQGLVAKVSES
jgi:predicted esterase